MSAAEHDRSLNARSDGAPGRCSRQRMTACFWGVAFVLAAISTNTTAEAVRDVTAGASVLLFLIGVSYI